MKPTYLAIDEPEASHVCALSRELPTSLPATRYPSNIAIYRTGAARGADGWTLRAHFAVVIVVAGILLAFVKRYFDKFL